MTGANDSPDTLLEMVADYEARVAEYDKAGAALKDWFRQHKEVAYVAARAVYDLQQEREVKVERAPDNKRENKGYV